MGRSEQDELSVAQVFYPCMQCADVFFPKTNICQLGIDQHKVNVLAREYCDDIKRKNKPVILSHHMLLGLQEGQERMSKSDPSSSIYMEDEELKVERYADNGGPSRVLRNYHLIMKVGNCILGDLKPALAKALNQILQPVRDHFKNDPKAKELVKVKSYKVTK
ncbi:tyrosine--tRNA ligase 1, cytoplasmic [Olea europaea subsp. europaea]|uniref:tyrosine--tRNA ligase n=1 Tax=Olea europaea subsp. europaea TaxID=158383 RepID=A0A8S0R5U9_OLEEU|nr:tyrosine--tRNA ligase 1, cytoplasmic [Olea europaea subsp. europaea]